MRRHKTRTGDTNASDGMVLGEVRSDTGSAAPGFHAHRSETVPPRLLRSSGEWHAMTIARTGAGKGVSCIVPALLQHPGTTIVIDPKGENAAVTARQRRAMGHIVHVVDPMGISGLTPSGLNPLDVIDIGTPDASDQVRALAQTMMPSVFADRDVFWRNRAIHMISVSICRVLAMPAPARRTLLQVRDTLYELLREAGARDNRAAGGATQWLRQSEDPEVVRLRNLIDAGAPETVGGMLLTATEGVDFLRGPALERSFGASDVDFEAVTLGDKVTIYLVLPPHMMDSHAQVLRLWMAALFQAILRRRHKPKQSTLLLLDEAAQLGTFAPLRQALTLLRGYGVSTWSFWQDASQLRQLYPNDWRTMANNCAMLQCFGATSAAGARDLAEFLGLANPHLVETLAPADMVVQMPGEPPLVARRLNYLTDPMFAGRFDPNPFYATRRVRRRPTSDPRRAPSVAAQLSLPELAEALGALWTPRAPSLP